MTVTEENRRTRRNPIPVPLCPTWTALGQNTDLWQEKAANNHLNYGTASVTFLARVAMVTCYFAAFRTS